MKILTNTYKAGYRYVLSLGIAMLVTACATQQGSGFRPSEEEFSSNWIDIKLGSLMAIRGEKPELFLQIANKKSQAVWVKVRFEVPKPSQSCVITQKVVPDQIFEYSCAQESVIADTPYPIYFEIFLDEGLTNLVEKTKTKMQFREKDLDAFMKWLIPPVLPATFKNITYTEKFGVFNAFFGAFKKTGILVVRKNNIKYTQGNTVINIPTSLIRSVNMREIKPRDIWVVIEYQVSGKNKIIGFQGSALIGSTDIEKLYSALSYAHENSMQ